MDVNMNIMILRLHPTRGLPNKYASSLMSGIIVVHALICARSSEYRPERLSGKKRQVLYNFGPAGRTRGSREWASGRQL